MEYVVVLRELNSFYAFKRLNDSMSGKAFALTMSKTLGVTVTVQGSYLPSTSESTNLTTSYGTVDNWGSRTSGGSSTGQRTIYVDGDADYNKKLSPTDKIACNFISCTESLPLHYINFT